MSQEWVNCPTGGKKLCRADAKGKIYLWCKTCRKEIEIEIGEPNEPKEMSGR